MTEPEIDNKALTHEQYLHLVREFTAARLNAQDRERLLAAKLVYGAGQGRHVRGNCFHDAWRREEEGNALIEVCAFGEESKIQLAGTTIHELGHCLAGRKAGHGREWKRACHALGLLRCSARGQAYGAKDFAPDVWTRLTVLPEPSDGIPAHSPRSVGIPGAAGTVEPGKSAPCPQGYGTNGGTSRGPGSGSRLRLYMCECQEPPNKARVASDDFRARCLRCGSIFQRVAATGRRSRKASRPADGTRSGLRRFGEGKPSARSGKKELATYEAQR